MKKYKAPGVYIVEKNAYPAQVVEVATDVPIFIGYTERAVQQGKDVTGVPVRVTSLNDFEQWFGKGSTVWLQPAGWGTGSGAGGCEPFHSALGHTLVLR